LKAYRVKKSKRAKKSKAKILKRNWTYIFTFIVVLIALIALIVTNTNVPLAGKRAAIVDALIGLPNPTFIDNATSTLNSAGFEVDCYNNNHVTVDLYRNLPSLGYKLIILRVHSGPLCYILPNGTIVVGEGISFFTGETYDEYMYPFEQARQQLSFSIPMTGGSDEKYFAIPPRFIDECMRGKFQDTVIILDSCYGFHDLVMAQALIRKGASVYIGWEEEVTVEHTDNAILTLLKALCIENLTVGDAVKKTMNEIGPDPAFGSNLEYYPQDKGDYKLIDGNLVNYPRDQIYVKTIDEIAVEQQNKRYKGLCPFSN